MTKPAKIGTGNRLRDAARKGRGNAMPAYVYNPNSFPRVTGMSNKYLPGHLTTLRGIAHRENRYVLVMLGKRLSRLAYVLNRPTRLCQFPQIAFLAWKS